MSDMLFGIIIGVFLGVLVGGATVSGEANKAKAECELTLSRNQECVMVFVPEEITK